MSKFTLDSLPQNLSGETTDDDETETDDDGDYSPAVNVTTKTRFFTVKYDPEAVVNWYMIALDKKAALKKSTVKADALGHLLASGWEIYYTQKKTRQELRYKSPKGKVYISLRTACKGCIDQGGAGTPFLALPDPTENKGLQPPVVRGEKIAYLKNPKDESKQVKSPMSRPVRILGNKKTSAPSRRNPRTGLAYLIDQGAVLPGDRVYYNIASKDDPLHAWGSITNEGVIKCDCCSKGFSISNFEAHTGSTRRRPAANIFLEDGRSLLYCQKQLKNETKLIDNNQKVNNIEANAHSDTCKNETLIDNNQKVNNIKPNTHPDTCCPDKNDSICSICHFGGDLILCDLCPASFHGSCLGLKGIPFGDWFCHSCCCKICGQVPYTFDGVSFNHQSDAIFVKCVQCELNVHIGCVRSIQVLEDNNSNKNIDRENWFCTRRCEDVHMGLQKLLWRRIPIRAEKDNNLTWTLIKHTGTMAEHHIKKLNTALDILHESFRPLKDPITKKDLIQDVIFSRRSELKRMNFEGFYTVILERRNTVASVATVRVYGDEVAEIPFLATRLKHRRQGMCRTLMKELEQQLMKLGVKTLTLPAVAEALSTWTGGFGFSKMTDFDRLGLDKYTFLGFQHTVRCQKNLEWRVPNDQELRPTKRLKQTVAEDDEIFDKNLCR